MLMTQPIRIPDSRGSLWHRWDPHIHTPGTTIGDQFKGQDPWTDFLSRIETSDPPIRALGITDYYSIDAYERVLSLQAKGHLVGVPLIFPNVEMRFGIETARGSGINFHLLFSPEDPDHRDLIRRFLSELRFQFQGESYHCNSYDLVRLGRAFNRSIKDDRKALQEGATQFKVNFAELRGAWKNSAWIQQNALVAVAGGGTDGTAGLKDDASFAALRREIETFADIIFSSHRQQREFWLGRGAKTAEELTSKWGGCKPCLHGSDAHRPEKVGSPDLDRFCWIKGDLTFESLRQACIEPEGRAFVDREPPTGTVPSQTIAQVTISKASFLKTSAIPLNPGLVAIIGPRGSGKTALADFIAAGAYAFSPRNNDASFLRRAEQHLLNSNSTLTWDSGETTETSFADISADDFLDFPRVQYLSQQFVDQLCSAEGLEDELLGEIERVIFQSHPIEDRMGASSFRELLNIRATRARSARERQQQALQRASESLTAERARKAHLPNLTKQWNDKRGSIEKDKKERKVLTNKSSKERAQRLEDLSLAVDAAQRKVQDAQARHSSLLALQEEVKDIRATSIPNHLRDLQKKYALALLSTEQWKAFRLAFTGDVDSILSEEVKAATSFVKLLSGPAKNEVDFDPKAQPSDNALIPASADLSSQTLSLLKKELTRLRLLVGVDTANAKKFKSLSDKISKDESSLATLGKEVELAKSADARIAELIEERKSAYAGIFAAIIDEEKELSALYAPLKANLMLQGGELGKLSFSVRRTVDPEAWANAGEGLLDLRELGPFKGKGTLLDTATRELLPAWVQGTSAEVATAMAEFRDRHEHHLLEHAPIKRSDGEAFAAWAQKISEWLYRTSHIAVSYGLQYDGIDIEHLSPGTRGIVMLLLYVAIDTEDDRPLIVDQPEENLDPKSIYDDLVGRFRAAKMRRQIIIITHNANLVVNTDADQVIVAQCGPHRPGFLPELSYESGGLENPVIRKHVCEILEGGEAAFKERARRLRVRI
jgi:energy-coupling factor transporter ATP-binding protein EcfA2